MTKLALLVGIDDYPAAPLSGCVNDAVKMHDLLQRNHDGSPNFDCRTLLSSDVRVERATLKREIENLFERPAGAAFLFFAGHDCVNKLGGYLVTQDRTGHDEGVSMNGVLRLANDSPATERIIVLDCCHSGALGQLLTIGGNAAVIAEGVTILCACRESEVAVERGSGGAFTSLLCDALDGGAADVCGKVTVAGIYSYIEEALGGWMQRPLFKLHVSKLVPLRRCTAAVEMEILRLLPRYFKSPHDDHHLDPSYEPSVEPRDVDHETIFGHLQRMRAARLVVPIGEDHLYGAAIQSKSCRLTELGVHYWRLANSGKL